MLPPSPHRRTMVLLFVGAGLAFAAWRAPGDLVWDDTPTVCENLYAAAAPPVDGLGTPAFWRALWAEDFGRLHVDGYRPLNWAVRRAGLALYVATPWAPAVLLAVNGALVGLLAAAFYRLARRFTRTGAAALAAVFLLLASTPVLTGCLVLFTGIQVLVPLVMCAALNCYFASLESRRRWPWLLALGLLLFVGPLYREFAGLTPLLVLALEARRGSRRPGVVLLACAAFLHALYPTALFHALFFPELQLDPVYKLGVLGEQVAAGARGWTAERVWDLVRSLKWRIFLDLLSVLPPTLFLLAAGGWAWAALRRRGAPLPAGQAAFLGLFFLLTFLPFLKVFKEQVHLAYCLVPAAVLLAASVEALWLAAAPGARLALAAALLVAAGDHALNPFVVRGATRACGAAVGRVAGLCEREMPDGSVLLSNAHHANDVRLACRGRFGCVYTTMTSGDPARMIDNRARLDALVGAAGDAGVYCLDVRLPSLRGQPGGNRLHWVVRDRPVRLEEVGEADYVRYRYPVLDPLKTLLPVRAVAWVGSPDLEFDYYRGPARGGPRGLREVAVSYHLYRVVPAKPALTAAPGLCDHVHSTQTAPALARRPCRR